MLTALFTVVSVLALGATANPIGERSDEYHTVNVSHEYFINEYTTSVSLASWLTLPFVDDQQVW